MRFQKLTAFILSCLIFLCISWSEAKAETFTQEESKAVHLIADKIEADGESIVAEGNVSIDIKGARLLCNMLKMDRLTGQIYASGQCVLYWKDDFVASEWMSYNPSTQTAILHKVSGQGRDFSNMDSAMNSDLLFWAETMTWTENKMQLVKATFTTCDRPYDDIDYKFYTDHLEIYPQDKLVASNTQVYIHDRPVYKMTNFNVSLDTNKIKKRSSFPQLGTNSVDGFFVRTAWGYAFDKKNYGSILLDYHTETGIGAGIQHFYSLGKRGSGSLHLYKKSGNNIDKQYEISSDINYALDDYSDISWKYNANRSEIKGFESRDNITSLVDYKRRTERSDLRVSHNFNRFDRDNSNTTWRFYYDLNLTPELSSILRAELASTTSSGNTKQHLFYGAGLRHVHELFDTELMFENTTGEANYYLNKNPELTLRSKPIFFGDVPLMASMSVGNVTEAPSMITTNRTDLKLQIPDQTYAYNSGRIMLGAGLRQLFYGTGESQYQVGTRASWLQELGEYGTARLDYNYLTSDGQTPLQHDLITGYQNITGGLEFSKHDKFSCSVVGGYNLNTSTFQNITPRLNFQPGPKWKISLGSSYNPNIDRWNTMDTGLKLQLTEELAVSHWSIYDFVNNRMTYQDYQLDYEAHDWITSLVYRGVQNEVYLQFSFKAFPVAPVHIGPNEMDLILPRDLSNSFVR